MCYPLRFDIHGIIEIVLRTNCRAVREYLSNEYAAASAGAAGRRPSERTIFVEVFIRSHPKAPSTVKWVRETYRGLIPYSYAFEDLSAPSSQISICIPRPYTTVFGRYCGMLVHDLIEPLIYFKVLDLGWYLLYASCVASDDGAVALAASGGVGKTTMMLHMLHGGYSFVSDDQTLVRSDGRVVPFPRAAKISLFHLKRFPGLKVPVHTVARMYFRSAGRAVARGLFGWKLTLPTTLHVKSLMPAVKATDSPALRQLVMLSKDGPAVRHFNVSSTADRSQVVERLLAMCDHRASLQRLILVDHPDLLHDMQRREEAVLGAILQRLSIVIWLNVRCLDLDGITGAIDVLSEGKMSKS